MSTFPMMLAIAENTESAFPAISPWIPIGFFLAAFAMYVWAMLHARLIRIRSALTIALAVLGVRSLTVVVPSVGFLEMAGADLVATIGVLILAVLLIVLEFQYQSAPTLVHFIEVREEYVIKGRNAQQISRTVGISVRRVKAIIVCLTHMAREQKELAGL